MSFAGSASLWLSIIKRLRFHSLKAAVVGLGALQCASQSYRMEPSGAGSEWKKIHLAAPSLLLILILSPSLILINFSLSHLLLPFSSQVFFSCHPYFSFLLLTFFHFSYSRLGRSYKMQQSIASRHHLLHFLNKISNFKSDFFVPSFQMHLALSAGGAGYASMQ